MVLQVLYTHYFNGFTSSTHKHNRSTRTQAHTSTIKPENNNNL